MTYIKSLREAFARVLELDSSSFVSFSHSNLIPALGCAFADKENASIKYKEPSRYPEMEIDLSFISDTFEPIANAIKAQNSPLVKGVKVVDTYRDENGKSITARILFSHPERTLSGDEVKAVTDAIIADLSNQNIALKQ